MFVPQNKYFASKLKGGECRCAQEGEEAEALLACRLTAGRQRFYKRGNVGTPGLSSRFRTAECPKFIY